MVGFAFRAGTASQLSECACEVLHSPPSSRPSDGILHKAGVVYDSCMSKTITIDDDAYTLLASLKQNSRDSFTKVILRHVYLPAETCGELLDLTEKAPRPDVDLHVLKRVAEGRKRRSGGRK